MVFQDPNNVWSVGCGALVGTGATATLQQGGLFWSTNGLPTWFTTPFGLPSNETALRAIAGMTINGVYTLFVVGEPYNVNPLNVSNRVWAFNSAQHAWSSTPVAVSPSGSLYKGLAPAPYSLLTNPSITPTAPVTPSITPPSTPSPLPCSVAYPLPTDFTGSMTNTTEGGLLLVQAGANCLAGGVSISSVNSPQRYYVWQSPGSMSGTLQIDTCTAPGFSTRLFVLTECPSTATITSGNLALVSGQQIAAII
jgi:hypothetical protein